MPCYNHLFNLIGKKFILIFLFFSSLTVNAQNTNDRFGSIVTTLDSLNKTLPIEKVHLHLDKPFYSLGDTIWIKAYVTGQYNKLSDLSSMVHLDLINDKGFAKTSFALPLTNGEGWGTVVLADSIFSAGNYNLQAYTNVMRNFNEDYFYYRALTIGNALPSSLRSASKTDTTGINLQVSQSTTKVPDDINLSFFPEGGNLISGLPTTVAFKAIGADGLSREVNGYVVDQNNNQIVSFSSEHAGMGTFRMTPDAANHYSALFKINGADKRIAMPVIQDKGYSLSATQDNNNIILRLISSANLPDDTLNIVAQADNKVYYTGQAAVRGRRFLGALPKTRFPEGIVQITVFSKNFTPLAERLVFIRNAKQQLNINVSNANISDKLRMAITATDDAGQPITGAFSIAVTNAGKVPYSEDDEVTILSDMLLTSDLKGYIEQPNYYFADTLAMKQKHLDNLMLTQGWRRFTWPDVLAGKLKTALFAPEHGNISGVVLDTKKRPVAGARVSLLFKTGELALFNTLSGADGKFVFNGVLADKDEKYALTASERNSTKNYLVELDKPIEIPAPNAIYRQTRPYPGFNEYITEAKQEYNSLVNSGLLNGGKLLKEVTIKEIKKPTVNSAAVKHSKNLHGPGNADYLITFLDLVRCNGASDLAGCLVNMGKFASITLNSGLLYSRGRREPMGIYVDGNYVGVNYDGAISDISAVEILNSTGLTSVYGSTGFSGLILITTKTGDIDYNAYEMERYGVVSNKPKKQPKAAINNLTLAPRREFYAPLYEAKQNKAIIARSTVYWKPNVATDKDGRATIEFVAGDAATNYRIILEGVGINGQLGRKVINYSTK
ncbi:hypothetical protein ACFQZS_05665 [Mucilaginibacter calamicampi]|uniref:TonB-dependent receptor plug domain-containing protein n=2 Tax=Mucilaginibacter calamicampi TaxID=1302352 RepID=A0ABW2YT57_9SPHI